MPPKNRGPCVIPGCTNTDNQFRRLTNYAIDKIRAKDVNNEYGFLKENDQLCYRIHYLNIVEPDRHDKHNKKLINRNLIDESSINPITNEQKGDLDWSKIKINTVENN